MNNLEILENISDEDLEFAIKEIHEIELGEIGEISDTISLNEISSNLINIKTYIELTMLCLREYSYRKAGLK